MGHFEAISRQLSVAGTLSHSCSQIAPVCLLSHVWHAPLILERIESLRSARQLCYDESTRELNRKSHIANVFQHIGSLGGQFEQDGLLSAPHASQALTDMSWKSAAAGNTG